MAIALLVLTGTFGMAVYAQTDPPEVRTIVLDKPGKTEDVSYKYEPKFRHTGRKHTELISASQLAATFSVELKGGTYLLVNPAFKKSYPSIYCNETKPNDTLLVPDKREEPATASWEILNKDGKSLIHFNNSARLTFVRTTMVRDAVMPFFKVPETGTYEIKIYGAGDKGFEDKAVVAYSLEEPQNPCVPVQYVAPSGIDPE